MSEEVLHRHRPVVYGTSHMVAAGHHIAAQAGFEILESGGNAIDAGVASIMTLPVVQPDQVNAAGVAPILVYLAETGKTVSISGLGWWPRRANNAEFRRAYGDMIPDGIGRTVVPSAPDAWITALRKYGTMTFSEVAKAPIRIAREGFATHALFSDRVKEYEQGYRRYASNAELYLPRGRPPEPGELFIQRDLACTLQYMADCEQVAKGGRDAGLCAARSAFYEGDIASTIARFHEENGGLLRMDDFAEFSVGMEPPVKTKFGGLDVYGCGPWCQGPVLLQMLNLVEGRDLRGLGHNTSKYLHLLTEVTKLAFADRERYYGDPRFVKVPIEGLLSKEYAEKRRTLIDGRSAWSGMAPAGDPERVLAQASEQWPEPVATMDAETRIEGPLGDTSYACVVDRFGNVFSGTPSDPSWDGVVVPGTGLCPSTRGAQSRTDPAHPASLEPGKRPRLTPNPAIVFAGGKPVMPIGSPGGDAQAQAMLQVILNVFVFGMDVQTSVEAPRFMSMSFPNSFAPNKYYPGRVNLEPRVGAGLREALEKRGHRVHWVEDWFWRLGSVCVILIDHDEGVLHAGADPRQESYAVGW